VHERADEVARLSHPHVAAGRGGSVRALCLFNLCVCNLCLSNPCVPTLPLLKPCLLNPWLLTPCLLTVCPLDRRLFGARRA
jgi:hypothetical protein